MLDLAHAHGRLPAIFSDQIVWIVQRPSMPRHYDLYTSFFGHLENFFIAVSCVRIGIALKYQMRYFPCVE